MKPMAPDPLSMVPGAVWLAAAVALALAAPLGASAEECLDQAIIDICGDHGTCAGNTSYYGGWCCHCDEGYAGVNCLVPDPRALSCEICVGVRAADSICVCVDDSLRLNMLGCSENICDIPETDVVL